MGVDKNNWYFTKQIYYDIFAKEILPWQDATREKQRKDTRKIPLSDSSHFKELRQGGIFIDSDKFFAADYF